MECSGNITIFYTFKKCYFLPLYICTVLYYINMLSFMYSLMAALLDFRRTADMRERVLWSNAWHAFLFICTNIELTLLFSCRSFCFLDFVSWERFFESLDCFIVVVDCKCIFWKCSSNVNIFRWKNFMLMDFIFFFGEVHSFKFTDIAFSFLVYTDENFLYNVMQT